MNEERRTKKGYITDNFDYSKVCNFTDCEEEPEICPACLERTGKERLGHRHEHLKLIQTKKGHAFQETIEDIKVSIKIIHCHYVLRKGTQIPDLAEGRNVLCKIGERWANKNKETIVTRRLKGRKKLPYYVIDAKEDE